MHTHQEGNVSGGTSLIGITLEACNQRLCVIVLPVKMGISVRLTNCYCLCVFHVYVVLLLNFIVVYEPCLTDYLTSSPNCVSLCVLLQMFLPVTY